MKRFSIALLLLLIIPALSQAQVVGTCEQYNNSTLAGAACLSNGSVASWFKVHGDVTFLTNSNLCSATNTSGCGLATVTNVSGWPFTPDREVVSAATKVLTDCVNPIKCFYVLDMRATSTITLPCAVDGQAIIIKVWQNPGFGGGFTPTFAGCSNYAIKWANGTPPAAVLTSGNSQMYSLVTDLSTEATPVYNEMRPGPE